MGRSKLKDEEKRRRYVFLLSPRAADRVDSIPEGKRSQYISGLVEDDISRLEREERLKGGGR